MLDDIHSPDDVRRLAADQLPELAAEIRAFLIEAVARTGGHLGPNLGVVELTIALHRVFDSPRDTIVWDTGHQAYVHKLLTGRAAGFGRLRQQGGLSGYPRRAESPHDVVENSHASTALSYVDGLAKARALTGADDRAVVAIVGDGALTGGMAWEALNNLGAAPERPVVVVLNDNGRSYGPTVGAVARHLDALRGREGYADVVRLLRGDDTAAPAPAATVFDQLGLRYLGPVDGHDIRALEAALRTARALRRPVLVHCLTTKGRGFPPAIADLVDHMHTVPVIDPGTGRPAGLVRRTWSEVFAEEIVAIGAERRDVVAITAAMPGPTGLTGFAAAYADRCYDVGIAEQHAVTSAAGLAMGGLHPVVAIYATFLNRAFDQVLMDAALHRLPVTFVLDRAGITGPDGPSHHGVWDLAALQLVPGLRVAAPRDAGTLRAELREAVAVDDAPTVVRFPKAAVGADIPALARVGGVDVLRGPRHGDVLLVAVGAMAAVCLEAAALLEAAGVSATVVDPRWVVPVDPALARLAAAHDLVVTVEDGSRTGGVGTSVAQVVQQAGVETPVRVLGIPRELVPHGERADLLAACGLAPTAIVAEALARLQARRTRSRLVLLDSGNAS